MEVRRARLVRDRDRVALVAARLVRSQRCVDRVVHVEVHVGIAPGRARIPVQPPPGAPQARHRGSVGHVRAELRREASREELAEGEAVGVGHDLVVRLVVSDGPAGGVYQHPGAPGRVHHAALGLEQVADQKDGPCPFRIVIIRITIARLVAEIARAAGGGEHAAAGAGVPEVEPALHLLAHVIAVSVEREGVAEQVAGVRPDLEFVVDLGGAPDLRRGAHARVALVDDQSQGVPALRAAVGRVGVAVLAGQVEEAGFPERQADVARDAVHLPVARYRAVLEAPPGAGHQVPARLELDGAPGAIVVEDEVHHPRDGVGAVLRRCAVAQHFGLLQRQPRNQRDVGALGAVREAVAVPGDDRSAVTPLPVHQNQRVVRGQAAQVGRTRERGRVTDGLDVHVEGRHNVAEQVGEVVVALVDDLRTGDDVDGDRRFGHRTRPGAGADGDDAAQRDGFLAQKHVELRRLAVRDGHLLPLGGVADQLNLDQVRSGGYAADAEGAVVAAQAADVESGDEHLGADDSLVGRAIANRAFEGALGVRRRGESRAPQHEGGQLEKPVQVVARQSHTEIPPVTWSQTEPYQFKPGRRTPAATTADPAARGPKDPDWKIRQ